MYAFPLLLTPCFLCPGYNGDAQKPIAHFRRTRGCSGTDRCLVPGFCNRKAGEERGHRKTRAGGFTATGLIAFLSAPAVDVATSWIGAGRAGLTAWGWDVLHAGQC